MARQWATIREYKSPRHIRYSSPKFTIHKVTDTSHPQTEWH
ncbi:Uncharacterised protein [Vibrio cholerae]|nr:Uncharacterised protein [Vibrio cholerae]